ncbi:hypothetical protein V8J36_03830 [Frigidibacter sp. MR17.14]|uniref:hypothetical protein n=1 Tax=Frigidibacter sp. MR17.14 TaxID=3126509 RepID=UPI003012AA56
MHLARALPSLTRAAAAALAALWLSAPVAEAAKFTPPQGCTAKMTVQMRGCVVGHYFTCQGEPAGMQHDVLYDSDGPFYSSTVDAEYQWIRSQDFGTGTTSWLEEPSRDAASFSGLLTTSEDSYDFTTLSDTGERNRYRGVDRLTGQTRVIDGVTLEMTEFAMEEQTEDGTTSARRWGNQFIQRDWRLFFSGPETYADEAGQLPIDNTPMDFIFPGEPGYLSTVPLFDCDGLMSRAEPPLMEDLPHDHL